MIQVTHLHRPKTTAVTVRRDPIPSSAEGSDQVWGSWYNDKHYSLEVIQHPLRARMCGFGDKDRRPLAPAAVAKMNVTTVDSTAVDIDEIDPAFFVVTVDLWSSDGKEEMNLVLHPSAADRYIPTNTNMAKPRKRGNTSGSSSVEPGSQSSQTPLPALPPPSAAYAQPQSDTGHSPGSSNLNAPPLAAPPGRGSYYPEHMPWYPSPYPYPPMAFPGYPPPPINSFYRPQYEQATPWHATESSRTDSHETSSPSSPNVDRSSQPQPSSSRPFGMPYGPPPPVDGGPLYAMHPYGPMSYAYGQAQAHPAPLSSIHPPPPPLTIPSATKEQPSSLTRESSSSSSATPITLSRHSYTRTLVGPLSANAARLNDEHRKPGIFFLFQDLSIRTEGTFRLRMRLMNIGAFPAPEPGANRVMTTSAPILAQVFTDSFTVYSAKRFPGVPDTTALSIAFGNQGQKLPLRNRHRSSAISGRRRQRDDSDGEESD